MQDPDRRTTGGLAWILRSEFRSVRRAASQIASKMHFSIFFFFLGFMFLGNTRLLRPEMLLVGMCEDLDQPPALDWFVLAVKTEAFL